MKGSESVGYAEVAGGRVAHRAVGEGPVDILYVPNWASHVEAEWDVFPRFLRGLASYGRLIMFDQLGVGLSDPLVDGELLGLEEWMDQVRVVLDAVESVRAVLVGHTAGGTLAALFAATHPDRVQALVLLGTCARYERSDDYPWGWTPEQRDMIIGNLEEVWGTELHGTRAAAMLFPSLAGDTEVASRWARWARHACSPRTAGNMLRLLVDSDIRPVLSTIQPPTLVVQHRGDRLVPVDHGRFLAEHIPGARYVELAGDDHFPVSDTVADGVLDEIGEFLHREHQPTPTDRVLATLVFTDIVGSTAQASDVGDAAWRGVLDEHDSVCRRIVREHRGLLVKSTGDGMLARFDGPARAVRCALDLRDALARLGLEIRAGVHTGEVELRGDDVGGVAVHVAARVERAAATSEVLVTNTVRDLVAGSGLDFMDRGEHVLKGIPGAYQLLSARRSD